MSPYLSDDRKLLLKQKKCVQEEAIKTGDKALLKEVKSLNKAVKRSIKTDKDNYYNNSLNFSKNPSQSWKKVKEILGSQKNLSPHQLKIKNVKGEEEDVTNPQALADSFNNFFRAKLNKLRE